MSAVTSCSGTIQEIAIIYNTFVFVSETLKLILEQNYKVV
jgi:hypothetical protein